MKNAIDKTCVDAYADLNSVMLTTQKLLAYCQANDWAGHDPYDALNSKVFEKLRFLNSRVPRLVLTQVMKRSPINVRRLALIPKTQNPKAIALFLSALLNLSKVGMLKQEREIDLMIERLIALRSDGVPYWSWGYSFAWQTRTIVVPRGTPNLVCTSFVANALLDAYEQRQDLRCLRMAVSAAEYILNELYWTDGDAIAGFSYPLPSVCAHIHNANLIGAALLCRVYKHTGEGRFLAPALRVARYSAKAQKSDGSWDYGETPKQKWIDNFHTGYNLDALQSIERYAGTAEFTPYIRRGLDFYRGHFFLESGAVRYFHNRTYPVDIHCVAQSIITLVGFNDRNGENIRLAQRVTRWAMSHMWDERGFFYYQKLRHCTIRTSYMRWSQAWMLLALSTLLRGMNELVKPEQAAYALAPPQR